MCAFVEDYTRQHQEVEDCPAQGSTAAKPRELSQAAHRIGTSGVECDQLQCKGKWRTQRGFTVDGVSVTFLRSMVRNR